MIIVFYVVVSSGSSFSPPLSHSDWSSDATSVKSRSQSQRLSSYEDKWKMVVLTRVPTIVTAHTFCAFRDARLSYGWSLLKQGNFCAVKNYTEKSELSKCSWYPKRNLGVTMHFSEISFNFRKKCHTLLCILAVFRNIFV